MITTNCLIFQTIAKLEQKWDVFEETIEENVVPAIVAMLCIN